MACVWDITLKRSLFTFLKEVMIPVMNLYLSPHRYSDSRLNNSKLVLDCEFEYGIRCWHCVKLPVLDYSVPNFKNVYSAYVHAYYMYIFTTWDVLLLLLTPNKQAHVYAHVYGNNSPSN